jgi:hypothetical protein
MVSDEISTAFMEDLKAPRSTPGRGTRQVALRKGDSLSGFTLQQIEQEKIVMVRGEEKIVVSVVDPAKPKARTSVSTAGKQAPAKTPSRPQKAPTTRKLPQRKPSAPKQTAKPAQPVKPGAVLSDVDARMKLLFQK